MDDRPSYIFSNILVACACDTQPYTRVDYFILFVRGVRYYGRYHGDLFQGGAVGVRFRADYVVTAVGRASGGHVVSQLDKITGEGGG